ITPVEIIDHQLPFEYTIASRTTDVMMMVLRVEKKPSVIKQPISPALPVDSTTQVLAQWNAVYDAHNEELNSMFDKQARVERLDLIQTFHACKQEEGKLVSLYVLKTKGYVEQLERLGYVLPQDLSVGFILNSLTSDFSRLKANKKSLNAKGKSKGKGKGNYKSYIPKTKNPKPYAKENLTKDDACYHCKEVGHCKRNYLASLAELIKKKKQVGTDKSSATSLPLRMIIVVMVMFIYLNINMKSLKHSRCLRMKVENQLRKSIKGLRSDRGGEYISLEFEDYRKVCGNVQKLTPPYTPQHNEVYERSNRTLLDMVRSMMNLTTLSLSFWDYALETATRILNMILTKKADKTPYELCEIPMEVEGFEPPQEKVVPVHRSTRIHRAPNRLYLNVEVKDYSLGDLNEPANYKAVILDLVNYKETFSPIADIRAIRILIATSAFYDYEIWQMDVKTAFLNGYLNEDIYMVQPKGFVDLNHLKRCFAMKDLVEATFILGIMIYRDRSKRLIGLSQSAYMNKNLKRFRMDTSKRGYIPMQERLDLNKTQGSSTPKQVKRMQNVPYDSAIGSIMYAVRCTKADVALVQNLTSCFQLNPGELH
nr:hypothetical protein [Tanacetum cinerariifolium]